MAEQAVAQESKTKADKHEKILLAAAKIFARKGFFNAKISEIAREAGVADGTIYLYFKGKDDILIHLFEEKMGEILNAAQRRLSDKALDPLERLERIIGFHLELVETYPDLAEVITIELRQSHKFMKEYVPRRFFDYLDIVSEVIREGQEKGLIRKDVDPAIVKVALFGALDELSLQWLVSRNRKFSLAEASRQMSRLVLDGIRVKEAH